MTNLDRSRLHRLRFVVAVVVAAVASVSVGPAGAQAPLDCLDPVVDTSGRLDESAVEEVIAGMDLGVVGDEAAVVVRTWDRVPDADLTGAVDEVVARCFPGSDGSVAGGVAILAVSLEDRLVDVLIGSRWVGIVDENRLGQELMTPRLADGQLDQAVLVALDEMALSVEVARELAAEDEAASPGGDPSQERVGDDPATLDSEPVSGDGEVAVIDTGSGRSALTLAFGVLGLGGCGGAVALVQRRRRLDQERRRLTRIVEPAQGRLRILRDRHDRLMIEADGWALTSAGRTRTAVLAAVRRAEGGRDATDRAAGLLHRTLPQGPSRAERRDLARAREQVNELSLALAANDDALDHLAALGAHLDHLRVALPVKAELLAGEIPDVRGAANHRAAEGWTVDEARAELSRIQATVDAVKEAASVLEVDLLDLSERLEGAEADLFAIDHDLETLPERVTSLTRWHDQLGDAADHELVRVDGLRRELAAAARRHAPESWRWVADHPERVVEILDRVEDLRDEAVERHLPDQRLEEAGRTLEEAGLELLVADDLLDEADDLLVDLESARLEAPGAVADSRVALDGLAGALDRFGTDVGPEIGRRHQELELLVAALERELARAKPHHLHVVETAEKLGQEVDRLLVSAEEQHLAAEALRRELDREVTRASRALGRARRSLGWQLFPSGDGKALDRLEAELDRLPADLPAAVATAGDIADAALRIQEQIIARRRRRSLAVTVGSGPTVAGRSGWTIGRSPSSTGGSSGFPSGSGPATRSRGGRSLGGAPRSSGGRSLGPRRSTSSF